MGFLKIFEKNDTKNTVFPPTHFLNSKFNDLKYESHFDWKDYLIDYSDYFTSLFNSSKMLLI